MRIPTCPSPMPTQVEKSGNQARVFPKIQHKSKKVAAFPLRNAGKSSQRRSGGAVVSTSSARIPSSGRPARKRKTGREAPDLRDLRGGDDGILPCDPPLQILIAGVTAFTRLHLMWENAYCVNSFAPALTGQYPRTYPLPYPRFLKVSNRR